MWIPLMLAGFVGYLTSLVLLIVYGISPEGKLRKPQAVRCVVAAASTFALWAFALWKA